ncbi:ABC transporter substrate-binding protein [Paenibacillus hexagrammi]|uniref:Sugar ABC transporter substrate-binding protein n=1 Tax=Paenibacillus hexagrammi TaxID=2908839 RepID=A0ABY3SCE8_9BACL|nr:sugar ABC transporter substrate-binding protein [Paenibacillus sp. YPD9-1]UJF31687.1 sugar ABC transporter substrate-binding protein [Paenibacillus sp. YPD9-1]
MKRQIATICTAFIAAWSLAGCTSQTDAPTTTSTNAPVASGEKTKLVFWTFDRHDFDFMKSTVETFNKTNKDNIEVEVTSMAENYTQSVDIAFASNQMPDILRPNQDTTIPFVKKGYLEPLDSYLTDDMKKKFESTFQDQVNRFNGKIYSLPNFGYTLRLIYNKDLFDKAGIANPPVTLKELVEDAKKITAVGKADGQYGFALNFKSPKSALDRSAREILQLSGYDGFGFDEKQGQFDFTPYKAVIEAFKQMKDDGSMLPGVESLDIDPLRAQFAQGKIGMYLSYSAEPGVYKSQFPTQIHWAAAQAPTIDGTVKGAAGFANSGQWLGISSGSKNKEAAWKFLSYMYSDSVLQDYHEQGFGLSAVPSIAAKAKKPEINGVEGFLITKYDALWPVPPAVTVQGLDYGSAFLKYMLDGGSLDTVVSDLNSRYNAALEKAAASGDVKVTKDPSFDPASLQGTMLDK